MMPDWLHPGFLYLLGAALIPFLKAKTRQVYVLLIPLLAVVCVLVMVLDADAAGRYWQVHFMGLELTLGRVDKLSLLFALVFTIMSFIGTIYALHVRASGEHVAAHLYVGSALGVVFAGDYFTLFVFWELMAFTSAYLVFAQGTRSARAAGYRYLLVHITGGLCLLGGIVILYSQTGSIGFGPINTGGPAFWMILLGFMLNAAVPPLNAWLTDAYPEATVTGAVFMSAFTTKTAIYVLLRGFPGTEVLVWLGTAMAVYGVVYAVLENDCRRLLAYHIVSQVGYMVAAVGLGSALALNGAGAHAFSHILYKGLLFMGAGAVIYMTGCRKLTELGGLYRYMPLTLILYMVGAVSISAFPLFSGFVSKSMILAAAQHDHRAIVFLLLTLASAGTFLHTGLKLPYYMFFGKSGAVDTNIHAACNNKKSLEPPLNMLIAMTLAALLCLGIGVFPNVLYALLPHPVDFVPYTAAHVTGSLSILLFTALGFFLFLKSLDPENTISLDTDWFYRRGARPFLWFAHHPIARFEAVVSDLANTAVLRPLHACARLGLWIDTHVIDGAINGLARVIMRSAEKVRHLETGVVSHYALGMSLGIILSVAVYVALGYGLGIDLEFGFSFLTGN